jgi:hypothetical protein
MKTIATTFCMICIMSWTSLLAQFPINLPDYKMGHYENDTIYNYYGSVSFSGSTGYGSITFGDTLASSGFITGVNFKMVVDSINQGASPVHAAFWDSLGTMAPMYVGDTLSIPASFILYAGAVGFHIIIEGTPLISGQSYLCDLVYALTTGDTWGMMIYANSLTSCKVNQIQGMRDNEDSDNFIIYPNPSSGKFFLSSRNYYSSVQIFNIVGENIYHSEIIDRKAEIDRSLCPKGIYLVKISDGEKTFTEKLIVR